MVNQSWITKVSGIDTKASAVHVVKRPAGRSVIPTGIWIEVRAAQPVNTVLSAIVKSPVGSKMDVREVLLLNVLIFNIVTCVADKLIDNKEVQPLNTEEPILITPEGIEIDLRGQLAKALLPIFKSPEGSVTDERDVHPLKTRSFNIVIEVGMVIEVRAVQPRNTLSAKASSPVGRTIDGNREPLNADEPIFVTPEGIEIDVRGQLLKALAPMFKSAEERITDVKDVQPLKTKSFKIVIEVGMLIDFRAVQSPNTPPPKISSPDGILTDVSELQPLNELASSEITPVADILMDLRRVEFWNTSAFIAITEEPRVTFAGIGIV
jgi:hypothetical protein